MESYTRYFVSQHLGKATATVSFDDAATGHVRIERLAGSDTGVEFSFKQARVAQFVPERERWHETLARIAIHQLHKRLAGMGEGLLESTSVELAMDTPPWVGDLAEAPYGGATKGYEARAQAGA